MVSREGRIVQRELRRLFLQFFTPLGNLFRPYDRVDNYHGVRCCTLLIMLELGKRGRPSPEPQ